MLLKNYINSIVQDEFNDSPLGGGSGSQDSGSGKPEGEPNHGEGGESDIDDGAKSTRTDLSTLPQDVQDYIKSLRNENKTHRTNFNNAVTENEEIKGRIKSFFGGDDDDDTSIEDRFNQVSGAYENMAIESQITNLAYANGIPHQNLEYFQFKMGKALNELEEGEEFSEEDMLQIINECKGMGGGSNNNSSVQSRNAGPSDSDDEITQEDFNKMSITDKSILYGKNPRLYEKLQKGYRV